MAKANINVNDLESFSQQALQFQMDLDEYKKLSAELDQIAQDAITATGGSVTQVGQALSSSFEEVNSDEMNGAIESLDKLNAGVKHISKQMWTAFEDFLSSIKSVNGE